MDKEASIKLYQSISQSDEPREYTSWHASSIAMCPRAQYMQRLKVPVVNKPTAALMLRWEAGHLIEEVIRPHILALYPSDKVKSNVRLYSKADDFTGEYDNLAVEAKTIVEVKSVGDDAFINRDGNTYLKQNVGTFTDKNGQTKNRWDKKLTPYLHHEIQNHGYALLLRRQGFNVENIKYIYISLRGRIVVYDTPVKDELIKRVIDILKVLNRAWRDKQPPECICNPEHDLWGVVLQYCPYREENQCCVINKELKS